MREELILQITNRIHSKAKMAHDDSSKDEILSELEMFEQIVMENHDKVEIGSIVRLETNSNQAHYFLTPALSGEILDFNDKKILAVSIFSALGIELMGKGEGEEFIVNNKTYKINEVI